MDSLEGKLVLVTGGAVRVGAALARAVAAAGGNLVLHYHSSAEKAEALQAELSATGVTVHMLQADLGDLQQAGELVPRARKFGPLYGLVNSAAIFEDLDLDSSDLSAWQRHLDLNLSAPFLLSQAFWRGLPAQQPGRIVNILDWRALRPAADHLPYTISKAGLAALTRSLAVAMAPQVTVNGIALGAILPPADGGAAPKLIDQTPAGRWAELDEVGQTLRFLLTGPGYITGDIIHLDGGRHLV
ncbi:MAG: SDR family oxidoreductase [Anaerolineales bacterium]|nr:SDR family oxidoreductase [Anaerolineales bacterium]MCW5854808.1 SDR family oxidoreductase [Anaerolineales bacterium]